MPRSNRKTKPILLRRGVEFELRRAEFTTFETLKYLDVKALERAAKARFEVGAFEGGCCRRAVHARVEHGRVVRLELEPCPEVERPSDDVRELVAAARKALGASKPKKHVLPMPVARFLANAQGPTIDIFGCFTICAFGYCLHCCFSTEDPKLNECSFWRKTTPVSK